MESDKCSVWRCVFSLLDLKKDGLTFLMDCKFSAMSMLPVKPEEADSTKPENLGRGLNPV